MDAATIRVLWVIGSFERAEMKQVWDALWRLKPGKIELFKNISAALLKASSLSSLPPELVVVCQSHPEQFNELEIDQLLGSLAVTSRVVCCYGPWCESDERRNLKWPTAVRVPVRLVKQRLILEAQQILTERAPVPVTASRGEFFEFEAFGAFAAESSFTDSNDTVKSSRCVVDSSQTERKLSVVSADKALRELWTELLEKAFPEWHVEGNVPQYSPLPAAKLTLWDLDPWNELTAQYLKRFLNQSPSSCEVLGLTGEPASLPLPNRAGLEEILPKDLPLSQLVAAVQQRLS